MTEVKVRQGCQNAPSYHLTIETGKFCEDYRMRSGEETFLGRLKQFTPPRRLGGRGKTAVYNTIYSITAIRNIMQMTGFYKKQRIQKQKMTANKPEMAFFTALFSRTCQLSACEQQRFKPDIYPNSIRNSIFSVCRLGAVLSVSSLR